MFVFDCPDDEGVRTVGVVCNPVLTLPEGKDRRLDDDDVPPGVREQVGGDEAVVAGADDQGVALVRHQVRPLLIPSSGVRTSRGPSPTRTRPRPTDSPARR